MIILSIVIILAILVYSFVTFHPVFGGKPNEASLKRMKQSPLYEGGKFKNPEPTSMMTGDNSMFSSLVEWIKGPENGKPEKLTTKAFDKNAFVSKNDSTFKMTWLGHSSVLINTGSQIILTDPVFSKYASPLPFTNKSFVYSNEYTAADMPAIDVVLISHDHYDHLDYKTIKELDPKVKYYYVPLGVEAHLMRWGVRSDKIVVADWWNEFAVADDLKLVATPARHFSGRGFTRNTTLWCSWVIQSPMGSLYFGADSGYGSHFKEIGEKYGPFDLTMIECGQYNANWANIHAMPEESVQAHKDLKGEQMMTIHWGKFQLALHSWTDPIERARVAAHKEGVDLMEPMIGDIFQIQSK